MSSSTSLLNCPICYDDMKSAFVTKCGHSFCHDCISNHHIVSPDCPICRTELGLDEFFPNFALNELSKSLQKGSHNEAIQQDNDACSLEGINTRIELLLEHKKALESDQEAGEIRMMLAFLVRLRESKGKELEEINQVLVKIDRDIGMANELLEPFKENDQQEKPKEPNNDQANVSGEAGPLIFTRREKGNTVVPTEDEEESSSPQPKRLMNLLSKAVSVISGQAPSTATQPTAVSNPTSSLAETPEILEARLAKLKKMGDFFADLGSAYCASSQDEDHFDDFKDKLNAIVGISRLCELASIRIAERAPTTDNNITSVEFNSDATVFAAGGVSNKIRVFNYETILNTTSEHAFPLLLIPTESKVTSICWNPSISGQLGSADYDGVVNVFDATHSQHVKKFDEHARRAWSLDFSPVDPTRLVSGSDDNKVKVWSMNMNRSVCTIDARINVCAVNYSPISAHIIAFGAADQKVHIYDLRNPSRSLTTLSGHTKAVSYVKWASPTEIVSASTDHSLKHWKLGAALESAGTESPICTRSYTGHVNERSFVGLDLNRHFMACGSETNTVHVYHQSMKGPLASYKFIRHCPVTGRPIHSQQPQFISSVAWKPETKQLLAANSDGIVKILELA